MALSEKFIRKQLLRFRPMFTVSGLDAARRGQDKLGELMSMTCKKEIKTETVHLPDFDMIWAIPKDEPRDGVMLYLHGGGYCCGDTAYVRGVSSILAQKCAIRVLGAVYRLAPESPFPAALDDALEAYRYLIRTGHLPSQIVLCGESAGGGLLYALCLRLMEEGLPLPCGIIAISPWTDLTSRLPSYETNKEKDPTMTRERLQFFANHYAKSKRDPLVSPLFADLSGMPPSLIFAGGDEIMLDDARLLHLKLRKKGCASELVIAPRLWHAYILYQLKERTEDFDRMNAFLKRVLPRARKLRWMRLDNAAKIYPAARRRSWTNVFRLSATLKEPVDVDILQSALDVTARRFPSISVRLCTGLFWYYLEELSKAPDVRPEMSYPLENMHDSDLHTCAFRVLVYENRIAVELFHSITDGNGGLVFLKSLVAEYLHQKYDILIPATHGILDRLEEPSEAEVEDSFQKYSGKVAMSRRESNAYKLDGTKEPDGFHNNVTFILSVSEIHKAAKAHGVSITTFLTSAMMQAVMELQEKQCAPNDRRLPVKILVPVNLRKLFPSVTLRNFVLYFTPEIHPGMGEYTFSDICKSVHHQMGMEVTPQRMGARITTNINSERAMIVKIMPLFIKNAVMKMVFNAVGERKSCFTLSNLGAVTLPEEMTPYVERFDFVISPQASAPNNCAAISYGDTLCINFIRNTVESTLEAQFYEVLRRLGIHTKVESNDKARRDLAAPHA
ncbi:MAG: alpha/beta hydrolase fold domain-containing protein [Clostridia bacterium]|nr:alpha/beta hydrolase fold domain-containing protein [Clostridia bacterium]